MKQEIDYVKKLVLYPIEEIKKKNGGEFYTRNLHIKSSYGDLLIIAKGSTKESVMITEYEEKKEEKKPKKEGKK